MACVYTIINSAGERVSFDTREAALKYAKENDLAENVKEGDPSNTTNTLANVLRQVAFSENNYNPQQLRVFQEQMLDEFIRLEEQSQFFYKMGSAIALTKGLGKNFDQMNGVMKNLSDLGIGQSKDEFKAPIDVRYLLTGDSTYKPKGQDPYYHKITANNIRIMTQVNALSKTMFMEQSPSFISTTDRVVSNLKDFVAGSIDKVREIKDDLTAFYQIAAYKQWIAINDKKTSTLRNNLIYDSAVDSKATETIVDIVKEANRIAPNNIFLQFILPVTTTVKVGKKKVKNINNKDLINTIEGKTRGKLEPDLIATMMDSFTELYQNPTTKYYAQALFDYLIVKDGLMFKNKSFIKMVPTLMFKEISNATDIAVELMSLSQRGEFSRFIKKMAAIPIVDREGNYKEYFSAAEKQEFNDLFRENNLLAIKNKLYEKIFGLDYNQLYNRFEQIYATDAKYQFNLDIIKPKIRRASSNVPAKGVAFAEENGKKYLHVGMFTEKFKATEKGSAERSKIFKETMEDLSEAGFGTVEVEDDKTNLVFKKYVRVRSQGTTKSIADAEFFDGGAQAPSSSYQTYQLVSVERDGKSHSGLSMTAEGETVPRGVYGVYTPVETVGTSNSTGVADLGTRPTKDQVLAIVNSKVKVITPAPVSKTVGTVITNGTYSGLITSLNENQVFVFGSNPLGINGNPNNGTGGAALVATKNGWVKQGEKMDNKLSDSGKAWGLTTVTSPGAKKSKTPEQIKEGIEKLYKLAYGNPQKQFLVAYMGKTGTNLNGYSNQELADMFSAFKIPPNMIFEREFNTLLNRGGTNTQPTETTTPTSPVTTEMVQGGIFGGMVQMPFDPNDYDPSGMDYVSDADVDDTIEGLDKC